VRKPESASRSLVDFGVLNDNLIKGLISCHIEETHMNKKRLDSNLVQLFWLDLDQERLINCYL
jgi:hypothetical protein